MPIQVRSASRTPNRHDQNRITSQNIIVKTINTKNRERILKAVRTKNQITYKGKHIKIIADLSTRTLKTRRGMEGSISSSERKQFHSLDSLHSKPIIQN
jgi:hypothetical protein